MSIYSSNITPWDQQPKHLLFSEILNPMAVIEDFFTAAWPWEHSQNLENWQYYVINKDCYKDQHGAGTLLLIYDNSLRLMEALGLLLIKNNNRWPPSEEATEDQIRQEKREWVYFPKNLSAKEEVNPYRAVKKCFKKISPFQYRDFLHDWLDFALSINCADETSTTFDILQISRNMRKLYSAAWIIYMRESDLPAIRGIKTKGSEKDKTNALQE